MPISSKNIARWDAPSPAKKSKSVAPVKSKKAAPKKVENKLTAKNIARWDAPVKSKKAAAKKKK
ncbi:hypothetical protein BH09BAC2_BH09BAC2_19350 [soil metagenome]